LGRRLARLYFERINQYRAYSLNCQPWERKIFSLFSFPLFYGGCGTIEGLMERKF